MRLTAHLRIRHRATIIRNLGSKIEPMYQNVLSRSYIESRGESNTGSLPELLHIVRSGPERDEVGQRRLAGAEGYGKWVDLEGSNIARCDENERRIFMTSSEASRMMKGGIRAAHVDCEIAREGSWLHSERVLFWGEGKSGS
jgi:hypothetical protein